jgi:hypothetical protein
VKRAAPTLLLWATFLGALTAVAGLFFDLNGPETAALLGGAAGVAALGGALIAVRRLGSIDPAAQEPLPDVSPPTVWLGIAIALLALGAALGPWLAYIGGGMALIGAAGVVRELRAEREAARVAAGADPREER